MRVLVCGGRDFDDEIVVAAALTRLHIKSEISVIMHGAATGADSLADAWALSHGLIVIRYPADWRAHGRAAGPMRNRYMLNHGRPDLVMAFPGGRGTADMWRTALAAGVSMVQIDRRGVIRGSGSRLFLGFDG